MMRRLPIFIAISCLMAGDGVAREVAADATDKAVQAARHFRMTHEQHILERFRELLSLRNVASDRSDMDRNAEWIVGKLEHHGFRTEIWQEGGAPYIFAEQNFAGAEKTVLIYAHFDGQPADVANWASPPWQPTLRSGALEDGGVVVPWDETGATVDPEWRIYARSAGDDKAPIIAIMVALQGLKKAGITPGVNIKLILDGEEEAGSPSLASVLERHGESLSSDLMLFCDGPMHPSRQRQLVFGVRGSMTVDLTAYGPSRPLHSGHYGNWAPNPNDTLIRLLASLKDDDGNILVPGYRDKVQAVGQTEKQAIEAIPSIEDELQNDLALGRVLGDGERLETLVLGPAIIVKGFQGGGVGNQSRNVIQPSSTASLNLRLVPDQQPADAIESLEKFFRNSGFHIVNADPGPETLRAHPKVLKVDWRPGAYPGFRSRLDSAEAIQLVEILNRVDGKETLLTPIMGGSLPIYLFESVLDAPIIVLPVANHDNNQHGRNENLRIQNLWDAIDVYAAVLASYGKKD
jgi:acetylornithine deacetylase/succinyl-diaminopimelate desuccinylase-like protein